MAFGSMRYGGDVRPNRSTLVTIMAVHQSIT